MPGGVVTANELHGAKLKGYEEVVILQAGTYVPYRGPQAPVNAIATCNDTANGANALTVNYATPGTGANAGKLQCFSNVNSKTWRITWIYGGG